MEMRSIYININNNNNKNNNKETMGMIEQLTNEDERIIDSKMKESSIPASDKRRIIDSSLE